MVKKHIVRSFDEEFRLLKSMVQDMGRKCETQISMALEALEKRDSDLSEKIIAGDANINAMQNELDELTVRMLATRQPLATDLRTIVAGLKISAELERIADYAANIAKHVNDLNHVSLEKPVESIVKMTEVAKQMLKDVVGSFTEIDVAKAIKVWHRDDEIDEIYSNLIGELRTYMTNDSDHVKSYTSLIFVSRCCERIGDHITNIAENVYYIKHGEDYRGEECP
jgi:phosphate transport system protein